ncbi:lactosylceramide 1,3-N-acetyl-beta-D-glucosaminyltransferase-like isoform X1 [Daphnia carinata]|uniref:lactosylceramide 1,3-N-acetyl-beta-D-glucosaminyltransferase-like isoform X1 n=1 Tax=Daphnia carinata TaxID=120202 RepID=UPI002868B6B6|nr:lactosylceramide 1,3-N-acetyl-beta-D-glucosaminyltransferase-like isoform X1 [Daphnia carinata]
MTGRCGNNLNTFAVLGSLLIFGCSIIYVIQPTTLFTIQQASDLSMSRKEETINILVNEKQMLELKLKLQEEEKKSMTTLVEVTQHLNAALIDKIDLLGHLTAKRLGQIPTKQFIQQLHKQKEMLKANAKLNREFFHDASRFLCNTSYPGVENYTRYIVALRGMLPLDAIEPLKPEFGRVINDVLSFQYPITVPSCRDVGMNDTGPLVFIAINSAPDNFRRREVVRQTWITRLKADREQGFINLAGFAFIVGRTENNETQIKIEKENETFGDMIQIDMSHFYGNLSVKMAGLFNWLYRNCRLMDFLLKVDDDVYVNVRNVAHFMTQFQNQSNYTMFGISPGTFYPKRAGKWALTYEEWPWSQYPDYFLGPAVLLPAHTILPLLAAFQVTPMSPFDDLYYTGMCREKAGISIRYSINATSVFVMGLPHSPTPCYLRRHISFLIPYENQWKLWHNATDDFYNNRTQCIVGGSNGINITIDHTQPSQFYFTEPKILST